MKRTVLAVLGVVIMVMFSSCGKVNDPIIAPTMPGDEKKPSATGSVVSPTSDVQKPTDAATPTVTPGETPTNTPTEVPATPTPTNSPTPTPGSPDDGKIVVVLDPGHGGTWTGATSRGYVEAEINLKIAFYCKEYIEQHYPKLKVYMTRITHS